LDTEIDSTGKSSTSRIEFENKTPEKLSETSVTLINKEQESESVSSGDKIYIRDIVRNLDTLNQSLMYPQYPIVGNETDGVHIDAEELPRKTMDSTMLDTTMTVSPRLHEVGELELNRGKNTV
jgi:hypothetical protein